MNVSQREFIIEDEYDFIKKVKKKFIRKRNNEAATKIQSFMRGCITRSWARSYMQRKIGAVVKIQAYIKMH